ncbi:hypothetical protein [Methanosarcina sp. Kolksee]|uniref:hypothetical protein n=1 Tax=Methanosarcina sp. Kolksee TaxID=1434099 RepID=UPI000A7B822A|nr:hypothetical protein [Methanosarcina sp. Kolksee]
MFFGNGVFPGFWNDWGFVLPMGCWGWCVKNILGNDAFSDAGTCLAHYYILSSII